MTLADFAERHDASEWVLYAVLAEAGIPFVDRGFGVGVEIPNENIAAADEAVRTWSASVVVKALNEGA